MTNLESNYTQEHKDKRRSRLAIILLICAFLLFSGIVIAYFSDLVTGGGDFVSGTLDIDGTYTFYINGVQTQSATDLQNLNPGDVVKIVATITNAGSKSAWVREKISLNSADAAILDYIEVYTGNVPQEGLLAGTDYTAQRLPLVGNVAVSANRVINGTVEIETDDAYTLINSTSYTVTLTIYFSHLAGNDAQGKAFTLAIETQALQFKNNNATEPSDAAWQTVNAYIG